MVGYEVVSCKDGRACGLAVHGRILYYIRNIFLVQAWFGVQNTYNAASWSISAEWFAYLLFPLAVITVMRLKPSGWLERASLLVMMAGLGMVFYLLREDGSWTDSPLLRIACDFLAGCLLYRVFISGPFIAAGRTSVLVMVCIVGVLASANYPDLFSALTVPLIGLLVLVLAYGRGPIAGFLSRPVMKFLGEASYSLYMLHGILHQVLYKILPPDAQPAGLAVRIGILFTYALILFIVPIVVYLYVEKPARAGIRKIRIPGELPGEG